MDMKRMAFPASSFDFAYSSLAMHYLKDWKPILKNIHRMLKPRGEFLFSTNHPIYWGAEVITDGDRKSRLLGYEKNRGRLTKTYGDYYVTYPTDAVLPDGIHIRYYHKPLTSIFREIRESGFLIDSFIEPKPTKGMRFADADNYKLYSKIPLFMIFKLKKQK